MSTRHGLRDGRTETGERRLGGAPEIFKALGQGAALSLAVFNRSHSTAEH